MILERKVGTRPLLKKVTATTAAAPVSAISLVSRYGFDLKADPGNGGTVYLGDCSVNSTDGYPLAAGETLHLDIEDLSMVFMLASGSTQILKYSGVS